MSDTKSDRRHVPGLHRCCRWACGVSLLLAATAGMVPACAGTYTLDQRVGSIEFSVDNLGVFTAEGQFRKFRSDLTIDEAHPEQTTIAVDVDAASVDMAWDEGVAMLRSPEYFDVLNYPDVHFKSLKVEAVSAGHYIIRGSLEIRRITRPCILDAKMIDRHIDKARNIEIADLVVTGALKRSEFGMVADQNFVSDTVKLKITAHLQLGAGTSAN